MTKAKANRMEWLMGASAWAIVPEALEEFLSLLESAPEAAGEHLVSPADGPDDPGYQVTEDGVAVIPLEGPLMRRVDFFSALFGGASSTEEFIERVQRADLDDRVKAMVISANTPGGTVDGTYGAMEAVRRASKPVVAYTDGLMASAGYWIASAADRILAGPTAEVGSIGVIGMHWDTTAAYESAGIKRTVIYSGKYKAVGSDAVPLDEEARQILQDRVDTYYALFVRSVAENRGFSAAQVMERMADGRTWIGEQAVSRGFVDQVGSLEDAVSLARKMAAIRTKGEVMTKELTVDLLRQDHPDLYSEIFEEGLASVKVEEIAAQAEERGFDAGHGTGVDDERARVVSLLDAGAPFEATVQAIRDGLSLEAAYKVFFDAVRAERQNALESLEEEAPAFLGEKPVVEGGESFPDKVAKLEATGMRKSEAILKARKEHPELFQEWIQSVQPK
jgi:signal peptide peptidase SppA